MEVGVPLGIAVGVAAYFTIAYKCCKKDKKPETTPLIVSAPKPVLVRESAPLTSWQGVIVAAAPRISVAAHGVSTDGWRGGSNGVP